jgi:hypothetical protein
VPAFLLISIQTGLTPQLENPSQLPYLRKEWITMPTNTIDNVKGQCFCGAVRFEIHGPLSDVIVCHCKECQRFHGYLGAYAFTDRGNLTLVTDESLAWHPSLRDASVKKGFCSLCGSSLFSDDTRDAVIAVAAGVLDPPTGLSIKGHVWMAQAGDYYRVNDGKPQMTEKWVPA